MIRFLLLSVFTIGYTICFSQSKLPMYQDSLKKLGYSITSDTVEQNRIDANYAFIKLFVTSLKEPNSFTFPYAELTSFIAIKKSPDGKFRIFSWFTQADDGTYRYYGAIQINNPNKLEFYPLIDNSQILVKLDNLSDASLKTNEWFGAVYYDIVPVYDKKNPYYILTGWKGKSFLTNSKILETLDFNSGEPVFGKQVLQDSAKKDSFHSRVLFTYTRDAEMMLKYVKNDNLFVFDHLVAPSRKVEGIRDLYAPDLSYDGYKFKSGKWVFQDNLKLKNLPDASDDIFIDPAKDAQNTQSVIN